MSLGSVDDDVISAMLESSQGSLSQGSLAGVIAPAASPDIFASFSTPAANFHQGGGLARASSMSNNPQARQQQQQQQQQPSRGSERWVTGDEKWILDAKGEVLAMHATSSASAFGADFDSFMPPMMSSAPVPPSSGGLHRYHSAPSTFLQSLAEDAFTQIPSSTMSAMFSEGGLTPITEQMDVERSGSGNSLNEFEQFLAPDSDFSRRAALSALGKPENSETFANLFPPGKSAGLVRQKSLPVAPLSAPRQDAVEEHHSEESLSGTSEDNSLKASMYDDLFSPTSWQTSPGTPGGGSKRPRGFPVEQSDPSSGSADNPKAFRLNNVPQNGLIRHASLPTPAAAAPPSLNDDHYVQMRARAKRGCATHPRSIAERVRRTRISERMKKLQDLVPNMEKTTNTSDMLDETVEYVKSLQTKVSELNETIARLRAAAAQRSSSSSP